MPDKPQPPRAPTVRRPTAKPVGAAPRPPVAKPVARAPLPARPVVLTTTRPKSSASGAFFTVLFLLVIAGGIVWFVKYSPQKPLTTAAAETPAATPETPVIAKASPVPPTAVPDMPTGAPADSNPRPMAASTAPLPNVPVPPALAPSEPDLYKEPLVLDAVTARGPAQQERANRVLRTALEKNEWPKYLDLLQRSMTAELRKSPDFDSIQRYDRYTANPYFMRAMLQHALGSAAGDEARTLIAESELVRQHALWVLENTDVLESFLRAWTPGDNLRRVLETWARLSADDTEALGKYRELAIACSLVFERPKEFEWNGEKVKVSAEDRYRWYKTKDKAGKLVGNIASMSAWKLAWVVGVPVPESEMEWTLTELSRKLKQKDWGRAYGMVPYDMQKAVTGVMKQPYDYYTFSEILKKGGICGDQSYFSANTARCAGIPAVSISGDGPRGPHAWMAWLAEDDRWAFSGRFDGYPAGTVRDPRNGDKISEQKFTRLSDSKAPSEATMAKAQRLIWLHNLQNITGQKAEAEHALEFALRTSPHQAELWEQKIAAWKRLIPPPAPTAWKTFLDALKREFRDDTDLLTIARQAEDQYVLAKLNDEQAKNELRGDIRDLGKLKGLTSLSEIRSAHERYAAVFIKTKDYAGLRRIYREALDDYGREASKFKALARDYWNHVQAAPPEIRLTACRDMEGAYERHVETRSGDYFDVNSQNSAAKVVADCWREAGETARAEKIEKEIAKRGKKATRNAL